MLPKGWRKRCDRLEGGSVKTSSLRCPNCSSTNVLPIVYGRMDEIALDLVDQGQIELGSTLVPESERPIWFCKGCWSEFPPERRSFWRKSPLSRLYEDTVKAIWASYQPISEGDRQALRGLN